MAEKKQELRIPQGLDRKLVQKQYRKMLEDSRRQFVERNRLFLQTVRTQCEFQEIMAKEKGVLAASTERAISRFHKKFRDAQRRTKRPDTPPMKGHNPVYYPPYDFALPQPPVTHTQGDDAQ